jgi:lipoprotein-anchoring transpeptidase ErfK/SrfK
MRRDARSEGSLIERPGRLAAVGAAALVCLLSVSGALGMPFAGDQAGAAQRPAAEGGGSATQHLPTPDPQAHQAIATDVPSRSVESQSGKGKPAPAKVSVPTRTVPVPRHSGEGRRIVFDMSAQRVWLVNANGLVGRTYPVSGSKYDNLQPGHYSVTSRSRYATAYNSSETLNYMVRFAFGRTAPIGFHAIPERPDGTLVEKRSGLGKPASDGCIRQWISDARALWRFAPVGTSVEVLA